ncbi:MAG: MoaD/ThiS family protein [Candidatus Baltobacteraceae bacterium]
MPTVRVLAFARLREFLGESREVALDEGATLRDLWAALLVAEPRLNGLEGGMRFACNERLCTDERTLCEGDEIALLPPFGGG